MTNPSLAEEFLTNALKKKPKTAVALIDLADERVKENKLDPNGVKGARFLGETMADRNLGGNGDGRMLRNMEMEGMDPLDEVNAWTKQFRVAEAFAVKLGVEPTNRNLMVLAMHPKADKAWETA